ncbi:MULTISPECIES: TonB-dependent hemoglobin/transferrin/lactoferrin family receptor [Acinetobacter]|uniref:TonB-dependent hemoglobin/transferrin/lactoferrin family receptor n=1 Tax=Acinetobacter TaxID=469 RepID=UPI0004D4F65E|nr:MULTISPECIES: TonB-dependent hemoglobin/transferrin/lactoferrin family receptor [unclassified Acinetobacter]KEC82390.1 TonB-dependent receptor [Acinetobacter sp. ETR1]WEE40905.1 TonB-dependent hemoglobin/transferrin/lactoferrin family receptor [Acinetobacter sp. TAC-1]
MSQSLYQNAIKPVAMAVAIALSMSAISIQTHANNASPVGFYQVQSGSLTQALNSLAQQANVSLLLDPAKTNRYRVKTMKGKYTLDQAFALLVQNTPFQIQKTSAGYLLIEKPVATQTPVVNTANIATGKTATSTTNAENQIYQMTPIVVEAVKKDTIQFGQSVLNQKAIDRYQANNVAQLLDHMPSVGSAGSPRPGGQTINILGMGGVADVPITLDDSVKTFDKYRQGSVFIEPEILKKITVDKGPHNVEVGNGGFGGKVTLETKDATDLLDDGKNIGAFLKYSRFSNNSQNTYTGAVYGKADNGLVDGLFYYTNRDSGNVKRPDGTEFLYSGQEQETYLAKLNFYPADGHKISLNAMRSGHEGWEPFAAMRDQDAVPTEADIAKYGYDEAWKRRLVDRDQEDTSYSASYEFNPDANPYLNLKAVASYSKTYQHDLRLPSVTGSAALLGNESWVTYTNTALKMSNISDIETKLGTHKLKVGAQYQKMEQNSLIYDKNNAKKPDYNFGYYEPNYMPAGDQQMLSAFIEDQYQINNFVITPSLRYDHIENNGKPNRASRFNDPAAGHDYSSKTYTGWSPRLAMSWKQADYMTWFANVSKTWRAPRVDEQYYVQSAATTVPSTSRYLVPEKMLAIRVGNEMNFDDVFSDEDHLQVRLTYHHNRGGDEIFRNRSTFCQAQAENNANTGKGSVADCKGNYDRGFYRNVTDYTIKAYEAEAFYNQPTWFAGLTYSYIRGQRDNSPVNPWFDQKTWMTNIPPKKATATLGVNVPEHHLTMGWRGIFVAAQDRSLSDNDKSIAASSFSLPKTKGYSLHSVYADWQPIGAKGPTLNFSIDNLFNRDYKMYLGEYMTGTGRDYKVSISQKF